MTVHPLRARDYLGHMLDAVNQIIVYTHEKTPRTSFRIASSRMV